jgi:hypothetical protein
MSYILTDKEQLEKAINRAKKVRPHVRFISFGVYGVKGSKGNYYEVRCEKLPGGEKLVSCDCKGGVAGLVCLHSVAALSLHIGIAAQRVEAVRR